jgi:hypothetical protein
MEEFADFKDFEDFEDRSRRNAQGHAVTTPPDILPFVERPNIIFNIMKSSKKPRHPDVGPHLPGERSASAQRRVIAESVLNRTLSGIEEDEARISLHVVSQHI